MARFVGVSESISSVIVAQNVGGANLGPEVAALVSREGCAVLDALAPRVCPVGPQIRDAVSPA